MTCDGGIPLRINARLDEQSWRKLELLKRMTGDSISELVRKAIDAYYRRLREKAAASARLLEESGLVGCSEGPADLSIAYKEELQHVGQK